MAVDALFTLFQQHSWQDVAARFQTRIGRTALFHNVLPTPLLEERTDGSSTVGTATARARHGVSAQLRGVDPFPHWPADGVGTLDPPFQQRTWRNAVGLFQTGLGRTVLFQNVLPTRPLERREPLPADACRNTAIEMARCLGNRCVTGWSTPVGQARRRRGQVGPGG
jgi:hypothetical protein